VGMVLSVALLMHKLVNKAQSKRAHIILFSIIGIACIWIIVQSIYYYRGGPPFNIFDILMRCSTIYPIAIYIINAKKIENKALKKVVRSIFIAVTCFLPIIILDEFNLVIRIIPDFGGPLEIDITKIVLPILYLVINLLYISYGFKYYVKKSDIAGKSKLISEQFINSNKISQR
jgi:hypothetical protein